MATVPARGAGRREIIKQGSPDGSAGWGKRGGEGNKKKGTVESRELNLIVCLSQVN